MNKRTTLDAEGAIAPVASGGGPTSYDAATGRFRMLLFPRGFMRPVYDYDGRVAYNETWSLDNDAPDLTRAMLPDGVGLLASHDWGDGYGRSGIDALLSCVGKLIEPEIDAEGLWLTGQLSMGDDLAWLRTRFAEGIIGRPSMGVLCRESTTLESEGAPPLVTYTKWELVEGSLTPVNAAGTARILSASPRPTSAQEPRMSTASAPPTENAATLAAKAAADNEAAIQARIDAAVEAKEVARESDVATLGALAAVKRLGLDAREILRTHKTLAAAREAVIEKLLNEQAPATLGAHGITVGIEQGQKTRAVVESAVLAKLTGNRKGLDNEGNRLANMSLLAIARDMMVGAGAPPRLVMALDDDTVGKLALGLPLDIGMRSTLAAGPGMISSSDFSGIIGSVFNTRMRQIYDEQQQLWKLFTTREDLESFDAVPAFMGGRWPDLLPVGEGGTVQRGSFQMTSEQIQLAKAARIVSVTLELILRDRIGLLDRVIADRAQAALRYEDSLFYARLLSNSGNSTIGLGTNPFFLAANTATGGQSVAALTSAIVKMATRATRPGDPVVGPDEPASGIVLASNVAPKYLHVPMAAKVVWDQIFSLGYVPTSAATAVTEDMRRLAVIGDANLDANGVTASFAYADPSRAPTWQWGGLKAWGGRPVLFEQEGFEVMGKDYLVAHAAYVMPVENIGAAKIPAT